LLASSHLVGFIPLLFTFYSTFMGIEQNSSLLAILNDDESVQSFWDRVPNVTTDH